MKRWSKEPPRYKFYTQFVEAEYPFDLAYYAMKMKLFVKQYGEPCYPHDFKITVWTAEDEVRTNSLLYHVHKSPYVQDGPDDTWTPHHRGDCEDKTLHMMLELWGGFEKRGTFAICVDNKGRRHAVVVLRTSRGDYILDPARPIVQYKDTCGLRMKYFYLGDGRWAKVDNT